MVPIPWMVAMALQEDGWYLRSDIIWSKPNPMPESVTDRPTKAHEYVFLLTKSPRYYYDAEAIREPHNDKAGGIERFGRIGSNGGYVESERTQLGGVRSTALAKGTQREYNPEGRNARSVWEIATQPYPEAHFATYPEELVRRCLLAGTSERGCCPECGAPWVREVDREFEKTRGNAGPNLREDDTGYDKGAKMVHPLGYGRYNTTTTGWRPGCACGLGEASGGEPGEIPGHAVFVSSNPCVVLDPFGGSGTTAHVARKHGRHAILIELNHDYCELAAKRLAQQSLLTELA
jgi:hypothetical protein